MEKVNQTLDKANAFLASLGTIGEAILLYVLPILIGLYVIFAFCEVFKKWEYATINAEVSFIKFAEAVCGGIVGTLKVLQYKWLKWTMLAVFILYIIAIILYFTLR